MDAVLQAPASYAPGRRVPARHDLLGRSQKSDESLQNTRVGAAILIVVGCVLSALYGQDLQCAAAGVAHAAATPEDEGDSGSEAESSGGAEEVPSTAESSAKVQRMRAELEALRQQVREFFLLPTSPDQVQAITSPPRDGPSPEVAAPEAFACVTVLQGPIFQTGSRGRMSADAQEFVSQRPRRFWRRRQRGPHLRHEPDGVVRLLRRRSTAPGAKGVRTQ